MRSERHAASVGRDQNAELRQGHNSSTHWPQRASRPPLERRSAGPSERQKLRAQRRKKAELPGSSMLDQVPPSAGDPLVARPQHHARSRRTPRLRPWATQPCSSSRLPASRGCLRRSQASRTTPSTRATSVAPARETRPRRLTAWILVRPSTQSAVRPGCARKPAQVPWRPRQSITTGQIIWGNRVLPLAETIDQRNRSVTQNRA